MEITGKFVEKSFQTFTKKDGTEGEKAQLVVVVQSGEYENNIAFTIWNGTAMDAVRNIPDNAEVTVQFDVKSRQWKDKWFTDAVAWNVKYDVLKGVSSPVTAKGFDNPTISDAPIDDPSDDLPF